MPYCSARATIRSAMANRSSASSGIPLSSRVSATTAAPYFFDQRQDGVHRAFLPVDRVDDGFSVVETQRLLDGFDIGGVDLQRSIQHALQLLNNQRQHPALIDLGHSHVDIQDLCACLSCESPWLRM